jgi:uncharacterized LabA/DUF88 family protein
MQKEHKNYAFIDSQNLNLGVLGLGWKLDFRKFRVYLKEKYGIGKAYLFLGHLPENENLYGALREYGYELIFKPVIRQKNKEVKGNIDAELVLQAMIDLNQYQRAVIVTGDGDFYCLVKYLKERGKLLRLIVPNRYKYSTLLRQGVLAGVPTSFVNDLRKILEYKN